jgi:hypothetical protein
MRGGEKKKKSFYPSFFPSLSLFPLFLFLSLSKPVLLTTPLECALSLPLNCLTVYTCWQPWLTLNIRKIIIDFFFFFFLLLIPRFGVFVPPIRPPFRFCPVRIVYLYSVQHQCLLLLLPVSYNVFSPSSLLLLLLSHWYLPK